MVMAVAIGSPPITATAATAKKTVKVTKKNKKFKKTIYVGDKLKLKVKNGKKTVSYKKLKFKSANKKIATVSKKGVVKAKKAGKVVISVKLKKSKKKCRLTVTVKKKSAKKKATKKSAKKTTKTSTTKTPAKTTTTKQTTGNKTSNTSTESKTTKPATVTTTPTPTPAPDRKMVKKKMYVTVGNLQTTNCDRELLRNVCWADKERTKPTTPILGENNKVIGYATPATGYLVVRLSDGREFIDAADVFGDDWDNNSDFSNGSGLNYSQLAKRLSKQINKTVKWELYLELERWYGGEPLETLRKYNSASDYIKNEFLNITSLSNAALANLSEEAGCTITFSDYKTACSIWADEADKHKFIWDHICYGDTHMQHLVGFTAASHYTKHITTEAGAFAMQSLSYGGWPDLIIDEIEVWAWE